MKEITIIGAEDFVTTTTLHKFGKDIVIKGTDEMSVSDGYHTFDELYEHRIVLFITCCRMRALIRKQLIENELEDKPVVWCSTLHSDGSSFGDWFVLGIYKKKGQQITYHLPAKYWEEVTEFAEVLKKAPEFDGHTSDDVLKRLKEI